MSVTAKIPSKGQMTLPGSIRKILTANTVEIEKSSDKVILIPIRSVAGTLAKYAAEAKSLAEIREQVWQEIGRSIPNTGDTP